MTFYALMALIAALLFIKFCLWVIEKKSSELSKLKDAEENRRTTNGDQSRQ